MGKTVPVLYAEKEECYGCMACYAVCPNKAISIFIDEKGFEYPQIDQDKCTMCCMCLNVCPFKNPFKRSAQKK